MRRMYAGGKSGPNDANDTLDPHDMNDPYPGEKRARTAFSTGPDGVAAVKHLC